MLKENKKDIYVKNFDKELINFKQKIQKISKDKQSSILLAKQLSRLIKANKF